MGGATPPTNEPLLLAAALCRYLKHFVVTKFAAFCSSSLLCLFLNVMVFFYRLCLVSLCFVSYISRVAGECTSITSLIQEGRCTYNSTLRDTSIYPNQVINETTEITQIATLVSALNSLRTCSSDADRFICSALFPSCASGYGPCSSLCEKIRRDCSNTVASLSNSFGGIFNCTRYVVLFLYNLHCHLLSSY